jgi:hypothetical protein
VTSTTIRLGPSGRIGRNDPCYCGSGRKYKVCHLRTDEEQRIKAQESKAQTHDDDVAAHSHDALCEWYHSNVRHVPAVRRPDFLSLVARMRTNFKTLMHVHDPRVLARDEASYRAAQAKLADAGIVLDAPRDPSPQLLEQGQHLLDGIFGRSVYVVERPSRTLRDYANQTVSRRETDGGGLAMTWPWPWDRNLASILTTAAEDDYRRLGLPPDDTLFPVVVRARVVRELLHAAPDAREPLSAGVSGAIDALIATDNLVEANTDWGWAALAPYALAVPHALDDPEHALADMNLDQEIVDLMAPVLERAAASAEVGRVIALRPTEWDTPEGLIAWGDALRVADIIRAADPQPADAVTPTTDSDPSVAAVDPITERLVPPSAALAAAAPAVPEVTAGLPERLRAATPRTSLLALAAERTRAAADQRSRAEDVLQRAIDAQIAREAEVAAAREAVRRAEDAERQAAGEVRAAEDQLAEAEYSTAQARQQAVIHLLDDAADILSAASNRWRDLGRSGPDPQTQARLVEAAQIVRDYERMERDGDLGRMQPALRAVVDGSVRQARDLLASKQPVTDPMTVPLLTAAEPCDEGARLLVALPLGGSDADVTPGSLTLAIASAVTAGMAEAAGAILAGDVSGVRQRRLSHSVMLEMLIAAPGAEVDRDASGLLEYEIAEQGKRNDVLRLAGVTLAPEVGTDALLTALWEATSEDPKSG